MRPIQKPARIIAWFVFFAAVLFLCLSHLISYIPVSLLPSFSWETSLLKFEKRLSQYRHCHNSQPVLVGASYVMWLPDIPGTANLGLGASYFSEQSHIIDTYCKKGDKVFLVFSIYEPLFHDSPPRKTFTNPAARYRSILRAIDRKDHATSDLKGQLKWLASIGEPSIGPLHDIHSRHPDITFIIHPMLPFDALSSDENGERIKGLIAKVRADCAMSNLPVIDLSDSLPAPMFRDLFHLTDEGKQMLIAQLQPILNNHSISFRL